MSLNRPKGRFLKKASFCRKKPFQKEIDHIFKPGRSYPVDHVLEPGQAQTLSKLPFSDLPFSFSPISTLLELHRTKLH